MMTDKNSRDSSSPPNSAESTAPSGGTLGTFAGVFTPSILTILGIILFLRLGYVVGSAGLGKALVIILLANSISVLTSISLAAIATNLRVKVGGDYYLISRTLGPEFGGALGIVLFLAQSISIAFYVIGFGEAVTAVLGDGTSLTPRMVAAMAAGGLFVLAWVGADWATRFQFVIMAVLFVAIGAFFWGGLVQWDGERLRSGWAASSELPFWAIFALFFPAVTGFTQGVSMSGDLKDPGRSLPLGTFLAVGLSLLIYIGAAIVFAAAAPGEDLAADPGAMRRVAVTPWLVDAGVIAATLSSALASFLGAPRIMQSLASDRIFPLLTPFAHGAGESNNPRRGVLLAAGIAAGGILLGNLDLLAPVVTMFFLVSYGLLNYATYYEARAQSPSFRPTFRWFHPVASLVGGIGCLAAMLAIHPAAGIAAVAILFAIHQYLKRTGGPDRWADSSRSSYFQQIRERLHAMSLELEHPRDWRPVILAFSENPERRARLLRFASWIEGRSGLTTAVQVVGGDGARARRERAEAEGHLRSDIAKAGRKAFARVVSTSDLEAAFAMLVQAHGVGPLRANTVLFNWIEPRPAYEQPHALRSYGHILHEALRHEASVVILSASEEAMQRIDSMSADERRIDVWWRDDASSRLALLLAYLSTRDSLWEESRIRLLAARSESGLPDERREELERMLGEVRIDAEVKVIDPLDDDMALAESSDAALVFSTFRLKGDEPQGPMETPLDPLLRELPITALVLAAGDFELDSEPEGGKHGEIAAAVDEAEKRERIAREAEKAAEKAARRTEEKREALEAARRESDSAEEIEALEKEVEKLEKEAEQASRRAARTRAKAEDASHDVEELTGEREEEPDEEKPGAGDEEASGAKSR